MKLQRKGDRKVFKAQRERSRMMEINKALIYLRSVLQCSLVSNNFENNTFQNLPKIETIKLAKNYIAILQEQVSGRDFYSAEEYLEMLTMNLKNSTIKLLRHLLTDG
ncbi:hypothetical protein PVAND_008170 [Polypedilum vanderplanki]|uniref:BHLH domain-containing protein n=1 Tax=Polypedilum vanderplanki TaxID=319348 RepID=A0A9J6C965_POLVA|nr:hypothetical protein PVAND_008170 [Polypedilum vanderplanki]